MRDTDDTLRRGALPREPSRPVSDALSMSVALIAASRHVIERSRARVVAAERGLAGRVAEAQDALAALGAGFPPSHADEAAPDRRARAA